MAWDKQSPLPLGEISSSLQGKGLMLLILDEVFAHPSVTVQPFLDNHIVGLVL